VVIIGAGLSGLVTARVLLGAGLNVALLDAADAPGGRIRTDRVDGMLLDRGFQLLNPKYPQATRTFNLRALRLRAFDPGAVVAHGNRRHVVADPVRMPREALGAIRLPLGSLREKLAFAWWAAQVGYGPADRIKRRDDSSLAEELRRRGIDGALADGVVRTFLAGVLGEDELGTSRRLAELLVRSFVRGMPTLPENGMQAVPDQLAALLPESVLHPSTVAIGLDGTTVHTTAGVFNARAVVIATDARAAAELLQASAPHTRALTTFYHLAPESPAQHRMVHLDADRRGPLVNSAVLTDIAPSYAPDRVLVSSTVLGADPSAEMEHAVRRHAGVLYGSDTSRWEHVATYPIVDALPDTPPGTPIRQSVSLGDGVYLAGDHRDTASIQGAIVSGRRVAAAVRRELVVTPFVSADR
jgi:phytoene dehydrogenase-like protein